MYRFIIMVDVEAEGLHKAYSKLHDEMSPLTSPTFEWESTDEAFDPLGYRVLREAVQAARMAKIADIQGLTVKTENDDPDNMEASPF